MAYSDQIAAATIYMEASGEGAVGESCVAHVILNRLATGKWGKSLAHVCLAAEQFSCWNTKDGNRIRMAEAMNADPGIIAAEHALYLAKTGEIDPTGGATHYHAADMPVYPEWASQGHFIKQIGNHRFYDRVP